ncbi:MAG: guanylate kinase, partial [Lachnospiraceae bacterium]|nr:guanylate kinase [Lachnospiraceae bacterium]
MSKIIFIMGKSGSGKDSIGRRLLERLPSLRRIIPYTTRPMRSGEKEGVEYHFVTPEELA